VHLNLFQGQPSVWDFSTRRAGMEQIARAPGLSGSGRRISPGHCDGRQRNRAASPVTMDCDFASTAHSEHPVVVRVGWYGINGLGGRMHKRGEAGKPVGEPLQPVRAPCALVAQHAADFGQDRTGNIEATRASPGDDEELPVARQIRARQCR
jgi:hypothetical protein